MATKLKRFSRKTSTKVIAFVLAMLFAAVAAGFTMGVFMELRNSDFYPSMLFDKNMWTQRLKDNLSNAELTLTDYMTDYGEKKEEDIRAGKTVKRADIFNIIIDKYESYSDDTAELAETKPKKSELTDKQIDGYYNDIKKAVCEWYGYNAYDSEADDTVKRIQSYMKADRGCYKRAKEKAVANEIDNLNVNKNSIKDIKADYYIYARKGDSLVGNSNLNDIRQCPMYVEVNPQSGESRFVYMGNETYDDRFKVFADSRWNSEDIVAVGVPQELFAKNKGMVETVYRKCWCYIAGATASAILCLLCLILLCIGAGWKKNGEKPELTGFDKIWSELQYAWIITIPFVYLGLGLHLADYIGYNSEFVNTVISVSAAAVTALCIPVILSQARRIKTKTFGDGFIIVRLIKFIISQWKKGPIFIKVMSLAIAVPLLCMFPPFAIIILIGLVYAGAKYTQDFKAILDGAKRIRSGETDAHIEVKTKHEMKQLGEDLNSLSEGMQNAVQTQLKSERMKTELITNVSHDLKTPLTGIITYVDLMKNTAPNDPKMTEYLQVVDEKTQRLSTLINDILEASKASSGAMKTDLTKVDWKALFSQSCGEMQDKIERAQLEIKLKTDGRCDVKADGRLLWRVMDNLINNCTRYAVRGSRVYAELKEQGRWCIFTLKNISAQELNISADELMERFTRGDRARYTEGSGLGLSIAKSLTELMGGQFNIIVDGDLFKAEVYMPLWTE